MDATERAREGERRRQREGGRFAQSSVINLPRPLAAKKNRRRARTRARTGAGSLLAHAQGGLPLSPLSLSLSSQTHSQHRRLPGRRDGSRARRDSLNLHKANLEVCLLRPAVLQRALPSMLFSRLSSLSKKPKLEPDFLGPDETHYIVIMIQQGAGRFGRTWAPRGFSFFGRAWSDKQPTSFRCSSDCISVEAGLRWILDPSSRNRKSRRVVPL